MIIGNVRGRYRYGYNDVRRVASIAAEILREIYIPESFVKVVEVAEKADSKFTKPANQSDRTLYLYIGGWRLVSQERGKQELNEKFEIYDSVLNIESGTTLNLYAPAKTSLYCVKTPQGDIVAELIEGKLVNILFDIFKFEENECRKILKNIILDLVVNYFKFNLEKLKSDFENEGQRAVIDFLTELSSREVQQAEAEYQRIERRISDYQETLSNLTRERKVAMAKVEGLRIQASKGIGGLQEEFDKLRNISSIIGVSVDGREKEIILHTDDIYINNAGKRYYIGRFDVRINPSYGSVRFINLNNRRRSYWGPKCHHPHVDQQGSPCWGNVGTAVRNYIAQNEFQALASLLVGYLESVNTSDAAGKNITSWDVVNRAGEIVQTGYHYSNPPANSETYVCTECQDVFTRSNIALSRGQVHVCIHCADKYFTCPDCREIHKIEDAEQCDRCGVHMCEDCHDDSETCGSCLEAERIAAQLTEPGAVLCQYCNKVINEDELHTCETCGEQGCSECITFDGRYSCPNHR